MHKNFLFFLAFILTVAQSQTFQKAFDIGIGGYHNSKVLQFQVVELDTTINFKWYDYILACPVWRAGDFDLEKKKIGIPTALFSQYFNLVCKPTDTTIIDSTVHYKFVSKNKTEYEVYFVKIQGSALVMEFSKVGPSGVLPIQKNSSTLNQDRDRYDFNGRLLLSAKQAHGFAVKASRQRRPKDSD